MTVDHIHTWLRTFGVGLAIAAGALFISAAPQVQAQTADQAFTIQVTPATLPVTLTPGTTKTVSVNVRNLSNHSETLAPQLSGFTIAQNTQKITLDYTPPANMARWVSFNEPTLHLKAGESKNLHIIYTTPSDVGFSYAAAITLGRAGEAQRAPTTSASLKGTVAIFNLITIDRPGAKRQLSVERFTSLRGTYEFLPATFTVTIRNSGNVIAQPTGNIFIQRSAGDNEPIATLPVNADGGYILPGSSREFTIAWNKGFPAYITKDATGGEKQLTWNWKNGGDFRIGRYHAKAVVVYNDGMRDVPLMSTLNFWVMPWRILIVSFVVAVVLLMGLFGWGRVIAMGTKKVRRYAVRK